MLFFGLEEREIDISVKKEREPVEIFLARFDLKFEKDVDYTIVFEKNNQIIATGSYTGNDITTRNITGLGFQPKYVKIWQSGAVDGDAMFFFERNDLMTGTLCIRKSDTNSFQYKDNRLTAFISDGFTIGDASINAHPNKNGTVYRYLAIG